MRAAIPACLLALLLMAGCFEVYESGSDTPIECDEVHDEEELEQGVPNPLRCERTDIDQEEVEEPLDPGEQTDQA